MEQKDFGEVIEFIRKEDPRYSKQAYLFVRQGLDYTIRNLKEQSAPQQDKHVSGQELLSGIRDFALKQYGPMAYTLLDFWGVKRCEDIGEIVYNLVDHGVLGKTENDRKEDFSSVFDFREAFLHPFLPESKRAGQQQGNN